MDSKEAIEIFKQKVQSFYGDRLAGIILYGSFARKEQTADSDIDLMVLLKDYHDYWQEVHSISDIAFEIHELSEYEIYISAIPQKLKDYESKKMPLFLTIKREGIFI